jgi:16S rRNA (guanine966-N2)-methyltransferase
MRIIAGTLRGRALVAPPGQTTRPTAQRMRQALFDMLMHAPWAEGAVAGAAVLDGFAGTGALGLEALSRGAASAAFVERDRAALAALRANIAACRVEASCRILAGDVLKPGRAASPCSLIFLDPPYGQDLVPRAVTSLLAAGFVAQSALLIAEIGREETLALPAEKLAERIHGAALVTVWRLTHG